MGVLHTDIKPENVLLEEGADGRGVRVTLVDLGTAFYVDAQSARDIQTREYRCPEGILGIWPFGPPADVWSVGCLVFELLTGETLFDPQSPRPGESFTKDESHPVWNPTTGFGGSQEFFKNPYRRQIELVSHDSWTVRIRSPSSRRLEREPPKIRSGTLKLKVS